jgi:Uma2 family endonuclease
MNFSNMPILDEEVDDIDYESIITEDDEPVDSLISEKNMRLLTEPLYANWKPVDERHEGKFMALANVGLFYSPNVPALVPDMMLSLGVEPFPDMHLKKNRSYFIWRFGKPPEVVIEIVSNLKGNEYGSKMTSYALNCGVQYYVIFDPHNFYNRPAPFEIFSKTDDDEYIPYNSRFFRELGLGLTLWEGIYEQMSAPWLRWCDEDGDLIPTGREAREMEQERTDYEKSRANKAQRLAEVEQRRGETEQRRAKTEQRRAETAETRAHALAEKLRALGINPDEV